MIKAHPRVFAGLMLLASPSCTSPIASAASPAAASPTAVDLGPSSRAPATFVATAAARHEDHRASPTPTGVQPVHDGGKDAHATGIVNSVDIAQHKINLSHGPISALGWPAMTMDFPVAPLVDLNRVKAGAHVNFSLQKDQSGTYEVRSMQPAGPAQ